MESRYWHDLSMQIDRVYQAHPGPIDCRKQYSWLVGALGNPNSRIWFVAESPSLYQIERFQRPDDRPPTMEDQWSASRGDKLLREMLVKYGFKKGTVDSYGGWECYITNAIKEADYTQRWRNKSQTERYKAATIWSGVLAWELEQTTPVLVVRMGKQTVKLLDFLVTQNCIALPRVEEVTHYAYIGQRAQGPLGPMHPQRVLAYNREFALIRETFDTLY